MSADFLYVVTPSKTLLVTLPAQVTRENARSLKQLVIDQLALGARHVRLDCSQCGYIDSTGLGVLISLRKKVIAAGGELALTGLNEDLRTLFDLTKLASLFGVEPIGGSAS